MHPGLRYRLAEKMAGEITLSDAPGKAIRKWRMNFQIPPGVLSEHLEISPSVVSDIESGRRKNLGVAVVGRVIETILAIDEERGGEHIQKYGMMLTAEEGKSDILAMHDFPAPVPLTQFAETIGATVVSGSMDRSLYGYTVVDSLTAILALSADEFSRIYGWNTERALIFGGVSTGKSPMVAIRVTPFKPGCVVLQGVSPKEVHPLVPKMAERDRITVLATGMDVGEIVTRLRSMTW
ncbi:MAG: transcriptional regulator [Methanomicrobiales archaeon]|nr:transcriptional regulator [Methanomicrobiales archaeon]